MQWQPKAEKQPGGWKETTKTWAIRGGIVAGLLGIIALIAA